MAGSTAHRSKLLENNSFNKTGWWQLKYFWDFFYPTFCLGIHDPIWLSHIFSIGLVQPPTSFLLSVCIVWTILGLPSREPVHIPTKREVGKIIDSKMVAGLVGDMWSDSHINSLDRREWDHLHPWKLTWNPKMKVLKMIFLFKQVIFRFQPFIFQGVLIKTYWQLGHDIFMSKYWSHLLQNGQTLVTDGISVQKLKGWIGTLVFQIPCE